MSDLEAFAGLVSRDHGLVVVSTSRADGTIPVVNAGAALRQLLISPEAGSSDRERAGPR